MKRFIWKPLDIYNQVWEHLENIGDKEVVVTIKNRTKQRTLPQNSIIHVLFEIMSQQEKELWNDLDMEDCKDLFKRGYFGEKEVSLWNFTTTKPKRWTKDLSDQEWIKFITTAIAFLEKHYWIKIEWMEDKRLFEFYEKYIY